MTRRKKKWIVILLLLVGFGTWNYWPVENKIIVSRETTYLTGPLNADGTVNYVAYLNAQQSEGVTAENNGALLLLDALGPEWIDESVRQETFAQLNYAPPADGSFFVGLGDFATNEKAEEELEKYECQTNEDCTDFEACLYSHPWSPRDFPLVVRWLKSNEKPLSIIIAATEKSKFYLPIVSTKSPPNLIEALLPNIPLFRDAGRTLAIRTMLRLQTEDFEGASEDLLAIRRLARLFNQNSTLLHQLVAMAIDSQATEGDIELAKF